MRSRITVRGMAFLFAVSSIVSIAALRPAAAATTWRCAFGPMLPGSLATFTFSAPAGLGNDTVTVDGMGKCSVFVSPLTCQGPKCAGLERTATIHGSATEASGANTLQFGTCDPDPGVPDPNGADFRALYVDLDVTITIGRGTATTTLTRHLAFHPVYSPGGPLFGTLLSPPFPGPGAQEGVLTGATGANRGSLDLFTRFNGVCPNDGGSFHASYTGNVVQV